MLVSKLARKRTMKSMRWFNGRGACCTVDGVSWLECSEVPSPQPIAQNSPYQRGLLQHLVPCPFSYDAMTKQHRPVFVIDSIDVYHPFGTWKLPWTWTWIRHTNKCTVWRGRDGRLHTSFSWHAKTCYSLWSKTCSDQ